MPGTTTLPRSWRLAVRRLHVRVYLLTALFAAGACGVLEGQSSSIVEHYRGVADRIIDAALADSSAYERLALLVDKFGHRFSGSDNLERALDWILEEMRRDGLENVRGEEVMVPHWVRGSESVELLQPRHRDLPMLGLGGSVGTPPEGVTAEVLVVSSFEGLEARRDQAEGKIVLFNVPFTTYGRTVQYRGRGAVAAARAGAVAALLRSVTPHSLQTPHTGAMGYSPGVRRIPFAAVTVEDAELLQRLQDRGERVVVRLKMEAQMLPDAPSRNVIAEVVGSEHPEEVVVLGGHIDSWDVGQGAMDDGGGSVAAWEAVRLIQRLGLRPRRTLRVVLWTNEEIGLRGGRAYRDAHGDEVQNHVLAMESDAGVFKPSGFGFSGSDEAFAIVAQVGRLLDRIEAGTVTRGGGGADIGPLMRAGVPGMGLRVEGSRYFWYHHTDADTIDKLDPREMALCVATMAVMVYVVADLPERLPRAN
ncbi:MAG: M20/M25/M40 family metallo-hydrolase [Gemmatimonadales bacterium]|nr:M20/M25/M40 family metallo-hydrolase [Gemmatimonadales bacterium]NIN10503.1 M20/M25/M40 family metallo-hydrolase [Gemmatimonadales bacterium]NIN49290.1 M20/M25/M40 family metallo-hydrolase [Gemmatimonadales bacterium]NIP06754.1 M20/M25/M40 family metallo-hydrolase [Gemmatimonadales bacterium]NIR02780.1 M20/M25/M40 family metallo-hydrolase [Gemmatimonadales bacterium]